MVSFFNPPRWILVFPLLFFTSAVAQNSGGTDSNLNTSNVSPQPNVQNNSGAQGAPTPVNPEMTYLEYAKKYNICIGPETQDNTPPDITDYMFCLCTENIQQTAQAYCDPTNTNTVPTCCKDGPPKISPLDENGQEITEVPLIHNKISYGGDCPSLNTNEAKGYRISLAHGAGEKESGRLVIWNTISHVVTDEIVKGALGYLCQRQSFNSSTPPLVVEVWNAEASDVGKSQSGASENSHIRKMPKPDVVLSDNMRIAQWGRKGILADLLPLASREYRETGEIFLNSAYKHFCTETCVDSKMFGAPFTAAGQTLIFNRTNINALLLAQNATIWPPTHNSIPVDTSEYEIIGSRGGGLIFKNWDWDRLLSRYLEPISSATGEPSFLFEPGENMEQTLIALLGLTNRGTVLKPSEEGDTVLCGLVDENFRKPLREYLPRLKKILNLNFYPAMDPTFQKWNVTWSLDRDPNTLGKPFDSMSFTHTDEIPLNGFAFLPKNNIFQDALHTILPSEHMIFSGTAFSIMADSGVKGDAYEFFRLITSLTMPYIHTAAYKLRVYPGYERVSAMHVYTGPKYQVLYPRQHAVEMAVPGFYPFGASNKMVDLLLELEETRVFRTLFLEIMLKNVSIELATERACRVIDRLLLPLCTEKDLIAETPEFCDPKTGVKIVKLSKPPTCRDGTPTPPNQEYRCNYVGSTSTYAIIVYVVSGTALVYTLFIGWLSWSLRREAAFRSAAPRFCLLILLGCVLVLMSNIVFAGEPVRGRLTAGVVLLFLGYGITYSALAVKLYRIQAIFKTGRKSTASMQLTDGRLFLPFVALISLDIIILIIFACVQPLGPTPGTVKITLDTIDMAKEISAVSVSEFRDNACLIVLYVANMVVLLGMNVFTSWQIRNVPSSFKESKFVFAASIQNAAVAVVILPMVVVVLDKMPDRYLLWCLSTVFSVTFFVSVFFVPKLLHTAGVLAGTFESSTNRQNSSHGAATNNPGFATSILKSVAGSRSTQGMISSSNGLQQASRNTLARVSGRKISEEGGTIDGEESVATRVCELEKELQASRTREAHLRELLVKFNNAHVSAPTSPTAADTRTRGALLLAG